ncbi:MAG: uroporphyrinogen decarboxylase family protein, partial [bacterium]
ALCAEISTQPLKVLDVDAVIIFQDILTPLEPLDIRLEIGDGGPKLGRPVRTWDDFHGLPKADLGTEMGFVGEAHKLIRSQIGPDTALIGFCGAPYTLATYLVEGVTTKDHRQIKRLRWEDPLLFNALLQKLAEYMVPYLVMQARAGADVIGFDHGIDLASVRKATGPAPALQGNLDPSALYAPESTITDAVRWIHRSLMGQPGHVFNLGHGILPDTPVSGAQHFVRAVQRLAELPPQQMGFESETALTAPLED